jgi:hypothetical protein
VNPDEEIALMVQDCENREEKLSDWERGFIDSLSSQLAKGRTLSERQVDKLNSIWERIT